MAANSKFMRSAVLGSLLFLFGLTGGRAQTPVCPQIGPNLVQNGDFEQGYFGFLSDLGRGLNNATKGNCGTQGWVLVTQTDPHVSPNCQRYPSALSVQYGPPNTATSPDPNHPSNTSVVTLATCNNPLPDHSTGSGFFLTIDPDAIPNRAFWKQRVPVCPNTNYVFSVWGRNVAGGCGLPAPLFHFEVDGSPINAPTAYPSCAWVQTAAVWYSGTTQGNVWIELINDQPGCDANDAAIDDVFFGICAGVTLTSPLLFRFCGDTPPAPIRLSGYASGFDTPQYQWQKFSASGGWVNLPGATDTVLLLDPPTAAASGLYRLAAAATGNIGSLICTVFSPVIRVEALPEYNHTLDVNICPGDTYAGYAASGVYVDSFLSVAGCDSVRMLRLTLRENYDTTDNRAICPGEIYPFGGKNLTESGVYEATLSSIFGCDSFVVLNLTVSPARSWGADAPFVFVPNVFRPDDDGLNDVFVPSFAPAPFRAYRLDVYDRWGSLLFSTQAPESGWDGKYRGQACAPGVYLYRLELQTEACERAVFSGTVTLLR